MSVRTLTVILNSNHSKKFTLVLQSSADASPRETILREARNKFRIKSLSIVFLQGGTPLNDAESILGASDVMVWVSKGEPYNGPPANSRSRSDHPAEVRVIAEKSFVDTQAIKQLNSIASLPGVRLAVGMPDLHPGSRFPIGCAIASDGVYPALVGSDVGCGIALYHLSSQSRTLSNSKKVAAMLHGLDNPWSGSVTDWLSGYGIHDSSPFDQSLGTVGAGNHFAEICTVERIVDEGAAERLGVSDGHVYLLVHTGSRGLGGSILANHTAEESNPYLPPDSPQLQPYLVQHDYAVQWAIANRDLVAYRIKQCLFPSSSDADNDSALGPLPRDLGKVLDVTHNSVTRHALTFAGERKDVWVHRKGAAPGDKGIAPCPGSRGHLSWLLEPIGDGEYNACSLAHGAGRRHGRNALHDPGSKLSKTDLTSTVLGSTVVCTDPALLVEERPEAYKDVAFVVDDMEQIGICKGVVVLRPFVTYKVREGGEHKK